MRISRRVVKVRNKTETERYLKVVRIQYCFIMQTIYEDPMYLHAAIFPSDKKKISCRVVSAIEVTSRLNTPRL